MWGRTCMLATLQFNLQLQRIRTRFSGRLFSLFLLTTPHQLSLFPSTTSVSVIDCSSLQHPVHKHANSMSSSHIFFNFESKQLVRYSNGCKKTYYSTTTYDIFFRISIIFMNFRKREKRKKKLTGRAAPTTHGRYRPVRGGRYHFRPHGMPHKPKRVVPPVIGTSLMHCLSCIICENEINKLGEI
jgi:hypothetical protein